MADQRPSTSGSTAQLSAKIMEAQVYFQKVVKQEMQVLVASGLEREIAVKMLLRRIVQSTYEPEESDVKRVMRQFQMIHDDAVRALIVKQEIGRLKRKGLDAFAAIELLTKKMQGISVPDDDGDEETKEEPTQEDMSDQTPSSTTGDDGTVTNEEMLESPHGEDSDDKESSDSQATNDEVSSGGTEEAIQTPPSEIESTPIATQDPSSVASSLCERIDQVSISAASPEALLTDQPTTPHLSTSHTTLQSAFSLFSAHSRKRRVTSGSSSPLHDSEDASSSPRPPQPSSHRSHFSISRPLSPTFRFPKNKKQKIWTDDTTEPLLDTISLKEASIPPPASPTGVGTASEAPLSSVTATPTKTGKRRRALRGGSASPELDEIDVEGPIVRVSKRHKA